MAEKQLYDLSPEFESQLPPEDTRCTTVLGDLLSGYAGVRQADFDVENGQLKLSYDPEILSSENALRLVRRAGEKAYGRVTHCAQQSDAACRTCAAQMGAGLMNHYQHLAQLQTTAATTYQEGRMEVRLAAAGDSTTTKSKVSIVETMPASPVQEKQPEGMPRATLEIAFTLVNAVTALTAFLGATFNFLPPPMVALLYGIAYVSGGYYGVLEGIEALRERTLNVDLLMILAAVGAAVIGQPAEGAALLFLFSLSNTLQTYAMGRSRQAIEKLLDLRPPTASVRRGSRLVTLPIEKLVIGDMVVVRPGERFPIDGEVAEGSSTVDQAAITGESIPVEKEPGDTVFAGTVNGNGALEVRVTRLAQDTTLAKIVQMVEDAQGSKARTQRMLDEFEEKYAMFVLSGAALLILIPTLLLGAEFYPTFYRAMTFLVVASPCALVISTPASILSAIANGARRGVLFKGGVHLEQTALLKVVAFDKTGTLTTGSPALNHLIPQAGVEEERLLQLAAAVEGRSEHPLARAIVQAAQERGLSLPAAYNFQAIPGQGVEAVVEEQFVRIGNAKLFEQHGIEIPAALQQQLHEMEDQGQTVMLLQAGKAWLGLLAVADELRPDAAAIVAALKRLGVKRVIMLTGDNPRVAASIAARTGVDEFHAGLLPEDKVRILEQLREQYGAIAMVGDGVNDAPALALADVGIAMGGAGTDVALETADVVLMADDLNHLPYAIGLAHKARRVVWQNLAFSLGVIVLLVAVAFGAYLPLPLGVVGHEGSTVLVVLNGLRLLAYRG